LRVGLMSSSQGDRGGLSQAAQNDNTQDVFDNPNQTAATCNTPEAQVSPVLDEVSPSSMSSFEMLDMESVPPPYQEVQPHWFFCRGADDSASWHPFSREDSDKLEHACNTCKER
ncbi:hypothetical protein GOODEAATRI_009917, partial [Goodea atripinnis]